MMSRKLGKPSNLVDVYAFAMIVLELVSLKLPFDGWEDFQIAVGVPTGERPDIPTNYHPFFEELMIECWQNEPNKRPQFLQILEKIKSKKGNQCGPLNFQTYKNYQSNIHMSARFQNQLQILSLVEWIWRIIQMIGKDLLVIDGQHMLQTIF